MLSHGASIRCQAIVVDLIIPRFYVDDDDLSQVLVCLYDTMKALCVDFLAAASDLIIAKSWMRHGDSFPSALALQAVTLLHTRQR
jgi:hypothetical protein